MRKRLAIDRAFAEDKRRKRSIEDLIEQQHKTDLSRIALNRASTVVECQEALKSFEASDLGGGHKTGGTREHAANRRKVLDRLRARAQPLPPDLANDWDWFCRRWDQARLALLPAWQRPGWGAAFKDIANKILDDLKRDGNALAVWMRQERREHLAKPALRL